MATNIINTQPAAVPLVRLESGYTKVKVVFNRVQDFDVSKLATWIKVAGALKSSATYSQFDLDTGNVELVGLTNTTSYDLAMAMVDDFVLGSSALLQSQYTGTANVLTITNYVVATKTPASISNHSVITDNEDIGNPASNVVVNISGYADLLQIQARKVGEIDWVTVYNAASADSVSFSLFSGEYEVRFKSTIVFSDLTREETSWTTYGSTITSGGSTAAPNAPTGLTLQAIKNEGFTASYSAKVSWNFDLTGGGAKRHFNVQLLENPTAVTDLTTLPWSTASIAVTTEPTYTYDYFPYRKLYAVRVATNGWGESGSSFVYGSIYITENVGESAKLGYLVPTVSPYPSNTKIQVTDSYIRGYKTFDIDNPANNNLTFEYNAATGNVSIGSVGTYADGSQVTVPFLFDAVNQRLQISGKTITDSIISADYVMGWLGGVAPTFRTANKSAFADNTSGIWMGYEDSNTFKLDIGDATKYIRWNGTDLVISGNVTIDGGPALGQQQKQVFVYVRAASAPATPTGGTFASPIPSGWSATIPTGTNPVYMSSRLFTSDGGAPQAATWNTPSLFAVNGQDGQDGQDGQTTYTWIKYADTATGTGLSDSPTGKEYIGLAHNKTTPTESTVATDYTWALIKGEDGVPGQDGQTTYTWIAYSDNSNGNPMYQTPTASTAYIGIATNKLTATESSNYLDYTWSKFKGDDGVPGQDGADAKSLSIQSDLQAFTFDSFGQAEPAVQTATLTAVTQNIGSTITWSSVPTGLVSGTGTSKTLSVASFGTNSSVLVQATADGITDSIRIVRLEDGKGGFSGVLTNESHTIAANSAGTVTGSLAEAGGSFLVYSGTTDITSSCTFSVVAPATKNGLTLAISSTGVYTLSGTWLASASNETFKLRANYNGALIDKVYSIGKAKVGATGAPGSSGSDGQRGPGQFSRQAPEGSLTTSANWDSTNTSSAVYLALGVLNPPVTNDIVTLWNSTGSLTRVRSGSTWVDFTLKVHGNLLVDGTIRAQHVNSDILSTKSLTAYFIQTRQYASTGTPRVTLGSAAGGSPFQIFNDNNQELLGFNSQGVLTLTGGLGANTIKSLSAFEPAILNQLLPAAGTGGVVSATSTASGTAATNNTITLASANSNTAAISYSLSDVQPFLSSSGSASNPYTAPVWNVVVRRNSVSGFIVSNKSYTGSLVTTQEDNNLWSHGFEVSFSDTVEDSGHGTADGSPLTYVIVVTRQSGSYSSPTMGNNQLSVPTNGGGATNLNGLNDVTLTSPSNGQALVYNSSTLQWENGSVPVPTSIPWANITGEPVYTTRWPTAAETGAIANSNGSFTGVLIHNADAVQTAAFRFNVNGVNRWQIGREADGNGFRLWHYDTNGSYVRAFSFDGPTGTLTAAAFSGNGSGLTNVNAATLNGLASSQFAASSHSHNDLYYTKSEADGRYIESNAFIDFTVGGDANTYYPVLISGGKFPAWGIFSIARGYNWTAPDTWYTSTHKGGLTLTFRWSGDTGWGGNNKNIQVEEFSETYSTMVGGMILTTSGLIVFLRGGTAQYRYYSPLGDGATATVYLSGYTDSSGTPYAPRANNSGNSEVYSRFPIRGTTVYSQGQETLTASNYNTYAPTKTGGGASGTWPISISGIANTANTANTANALTIPRLINRKLFDGSANIEVSEWFHSLRDFANGTLVTTSIDYSVTSGDPWVLEVTGNSYSGAESFDLKAHGYIYSNTIINVGGHINGYNMTGIVALNVGGKLCFWWPRYGYWQGFNVRVYTAYSNNENRVVSIADSADPGGTKRVDISSKLRTTPVPTSMLSMVGGASKVPQFDTGGYLQVRNWILSGDDTGIYYPNGTHFRSTRSGTMRLHGGSADTEIIFATSGDTVRGYVYANDSNQIGFLDQTRNWQLRCAGGKTYFGVTTNAGLYDNGNRLTVRSEGVDDVANFASYGLYLPKVGVTAGLYVESPIEARGGIRLGVGAGNGTISGTSSSQLYKMWEFSTTLSNSDDYDNSPITIRERDRVGASDGADTRAPNLCFHWAGRVANSLWMANNGELRWGGYGGTGIPSADGMFRAAVLTGTVAVSGGRLFAGYDAGLANSISCSDWFRSSGATGWYNDTYEGGIHMTDSTYVRVYNGKQFYVANTTVNAILTTGGVTAGYVGVSNTLPTSGNGLSLYGGASIGQPTYGMMFAGTGTFGGHGSVASADWATYFTMNAATNRGWIFKAGSGSSGNVASISGGGNAQFNGTVTAGGYVYAPRFYATSSLRYKNIERVASVGESIERVKQLGSLGVSVGTYKKDEKAAKNRWVIAESVANISPEAVQFDDQGRPDSVDYDQLIPDLYAALSYALAEIEELKRRLHYGQ